jgi:hypothetical protein
MNKGSGMGIVLFVAIMFFVMEYTNFPAQIAAMLSAFMAARSPAPAQTPVPSATAVINAAGQIATATEAATSNTQPMTSGSVQ